MDTYVDLYSYLCGLRNCTLFALSYEYLLFNEHELNRDKLDLLNNCIIKVTYDAPFGILIIKGC